jgi:hypothetical protein
MSRIQFSKKKTICTALLCGLLVAVLSAAFTQAQNKKEITLKDSFTRINKSQVKLNDGFEWTKKSDKSVGVMHKASKKVLGDLGCGVCPGGTCTFLFDTPTKGSCHGCGGNRDCTIDPFN